MKPALIDSCVIISRALKMELVEPAGRVLQSYKPHVLDLTGIEIANALRNNVRVGAVTLDKAVGILRSFSGNFIAHDSAPYLEDALRLGAEFEHGVYDCIYVACARRKQMPLYTADRKLFRKFKVLDGLTVFDIHDLPDILA